MLSIRQYRKKIKTAKNIAKITKAMEMVAASKMKHAQEQAEAGKEYAQELLILSKHLSANLDSELHLLLKKSDVDKARELVVFIAPEKGLCGSLITNIYKKFAQLKEANRGEYIFITVGKKAKKIVSKLRGNIIADFEIGFSKPSYDLVPTIAKLIKEKFLASEVEKVSVFYSEFINVMSQVPMYKLLLPLEFDNNVEVTKTKTDYLFEPSATSVVEFLLNRYLEVEIYQFLLEAYASEQSARMVAMKNATDNAESLITDLSMSYNKARQASITNELTDISSANLMV